MKINQIKQEVSNLYNNVTLRATAVTTTVSLTLSETVNAASVITAEDKTVIETGFGTIQDTVIDVVFTALPYGLGIMAVYLAPSVIKKVANLFAK